MSETKMSRSPVAVIGAGISGLVLGQCLRRKNIPAVIYERLKANPTRNNYGITLDKPVYKSLLETLQTTEDDFRRRVGVHHPYNDAVASDDGKLRVNRAALSNILENGLDIRWEHQLSKILPNGKSRSAVFQTGIGESTEEYDLLIGADGVHSAARAQLDLPKSAFDLEVLPYIVFNGKRRIKYSDFPKELLDCFENPDGISHAQDGAVLSIKADFWDAKKQLVAVSYTLSRAASEADQPLLDRNLRDAETLAERFVEEVEDLGELPSPFYQVFNPETMSQDRLLHWLMRSALVDDKALEDVASNKGVVLLGDAAHAQQIPGSGANLAIEDALALAQYINQAGELDVSAFLAARLQQWVDGKRENERTLEESIHGYDPKARI